MGRAISNKYYYSLFPFIPFLGSDILNGPSTLSGINKVILAVLSFTIILLYCILNIVAYAGVLYIIKYNDLEQKYPKLRPIIKYYQNTSIILIIVEIIFVVSSLVLVVGLCLHLLYLGNGGL